MGFLGFLKKKKEIADLGGEPFDIPMPPPKADDDAGMPSFPDEVPEEDLKLPEIPELELQTPENSDIPELSDMPKEPMFPKPIKPASIGIGAEFMPEKIPEIPTMETTEIKIPMPERMMPPPQHVEKKHEVQTPKMMSAPKPQFQKAHIYHDSDIVFIKGEDYREVVEGLDEVLSKHNEKLANPEKDVHGIEEREHRRFIANIEQLQHDLMTTENALFG